MRGLGEAVIARVNPDSGYKCTAVAKQQHPHGGDREREQSCEISTHGGGDREACAEAARERGDAPSRQEGKRRANAVRLVHCCESVSALLA